MTRLESVRTLVSWFWSRWQGAPKGGVSPLRSPADRLGTPTNPRYFTDDSGRAIYLTGSHFWTTIQEWNEAKTKSRLKL